MRPALVAALALLAVLAGCTAPTTSPAGSPASPSPATAAESPSASAPSPDGDPDEDVLGWEGGYWYDESLAVNGSDGLTEREREAVVARTMARVEHIRGKEFEEPVPVEVISRADYRDRPRGRPAPPDVRTFENTLWESMLLVGEDRSSAAAFDVLYGTSVAGFYTPAEGGRIVLVSDTPDRPTVDTGVLAHELVHALQDQHFGGGPVGRTLDAQLARQGLTEGDPNYVQHIYEQRCATNWSCVAAPEQPAREPPPGYNQGLFLTIFVPYAEGPQLVRSLHRSGGWEAVDRAYADSPASTEQVIHPGRYPDDSPTTAAVPDRSDGRWDRFMDLPRGESEIQRMGEATLFAMLWANGAVNRSGLTASSDPLAPYNYSAPATDGWVGDRVVPYRTDGGETGYVLKTVWDTRSDARKFERAYRDALANHSARERSEDVLVVPDGPFADAFRVTRDGRRVVVVNGPRVASLERIHPRESE